MSLGEFKKKLWGINVSPKVISGALLEIDAQSVDSVKPSDRNRVLNICKRRSKIKRRKHLAQDESPMESHGIEFVREPDRIEMERGVPEIEY